ncbi:hypothetical protein GUITHDRAFT_113191 [Guillardia theta CCMP2712]|uniref:Uncharacterized protein n=1 Tax=Guillardia theta (strain CCMP2712) TaxID=905079 RepID=L1IX16_GUITC|nr:hypothetical protein GUITHDRAFT_113191 [Guillardia theta CCMP2712]EKX40657.1 hypothetical protein GUITHDRAFT_113191 [Guillardia theta CCMP2712]|eukprot:XP_005827637.1 hypothetical protein GUITHDRAFT_113191 [Guillardia theta CCMP2712]
MEATNDSRFHAIEASNNPPSRKMSTGSDTSQMSIQSSRSSSSLLLTQRKAVNDMTPAEHAFTILHQVQVQHGIESFAKVHESPSAIVENKEYAKVRFEDNR